MACDLISYVISPLAPGNSNPGPTSTDEDNLCGCNTVVYSLSSACDACQEERWITRLPHWGSHNPRHVISWPEYIIECTKPLCAVQYLIF